MGDNCTIYQGVTLGGVGTKKGKRHPTLGNNVTVGSGAKILGSFQVGDNCSIAANAVLLQPLEENITAVGIPARPVKKDGVKIQKKEKVVLGEHDRKLVEQIEALKGEIKQLKRELRRMERELDEKDKGEKRMVKLQDNETVRDNQKKPADRCRDIEKSVIKQFRKEIWRPFVKALNEYDMIQEGDNIAVCISGARIPCC